MGLMNEYISIADFAKRAGVSRQAVYKAMSTRLSSYCQEVDNQRMLSVKALSEIYGVEVDNEVDNTVKQVDREVDSNLTAQELLIQTLQAQVEDLREQVKTKDEQLASILRLQEQQNALALADKGVKFLAEGDSPEGSTPPASTKAKWFQFWRK